MHERPKTKTLFISGISDKREVEILQIQKNGKKIWKGSGNSNIMQAIEDDLISKAVITLDTNPKQSIKEYPVNAVFNQISDADTHTISLNKASEMYESVKGKVPFFNIPENIKKTTREHIYQLLQGIDKLHVPKTIRFKPKSPLQIHDIIQKEDFSFPVIFRKAGDHGGVSTLLVKNKSEMFYPYALDGSDYYLTQYVEYSEDEIYTKYRLIVVDGEVFIRHAIFGKVWMMHSISQLEEEESNKYKLPVAKCFSAEIKPAIQPVVTEIHKRLGLDYFGIDCHIDTDMNLLAFEINANMNIFIGTENNIFEQHTELAKQALIRMILTKKRTNE